MLSVCPHCQAPQKKPGQRFCSRCGKALNSGPVPAAIPAPASQVNQRTLRLGTTSFAAKLMIEDSGQSSEQLLSDVPMTLGRAPHHHVVLQSPFISANHARIEPDGVGHKITDIGSTNGLLYHGQRLPAHTPYTLVDGDLIRIGDPISGGFVSLTYMNAAMAVPPQVPQIQLPTPGTKLLIGRDQCEVTLNHPQVSRQHAAIEGQADGRWVVRDLGSTNGTYVNGHAIHVHTLQVGDIVQIGPFKLNCSGTALIHQDERRAMRIEARDLVVARPDPQATLVRQMAAGVQRKPGPQKLILQHVSLCVEPGEFVALVGGSGAGKSTLMGALAGVTGATSGSVRVNGDDFYQNFDAYRAVLGYVPQDDIAHRMLSVERALAYTARLRLPDDTSRQEIEERITQVLQDVEMTEHRFKLVDNLSGGQRKRVSISLELLADPTLFFLDEPTSGLDPGLEKKMMYTLRRLADSGRTVALVTHATANIDQCDLVAFMAAGRLVYYGPPAEAHLFFGITSNDFADIYTRIDGRFDPQDPVFAQDAAMQQVYQDWQQVHPRAKQAPWLAELWEVRFKQSPYYQQYVDDRLHQARARGGTGAHQMPALSATAKPPSHPLRQFWLLTRRYFDLVLQDRRNLLILLLQAPIIAALMALVIAADAVTGSDASFASARPVMFMLATIAVWFGIINAAREITKEAPNLSPRAAGEPAHSAVCAIEGGGADAAGDCAECVAAGDCGL